MIKKTIEIIHEVGINVMIDIFTTIVLTLTFIVVAIYTYVTHQLHKATRDQTNELIKQRKLSIMPSLIHRLEHDSLTTRKFVVKNIGNGDAININIDNIVFKEDEKSYFEFDNVDMISPNEEKEVKATLFYANKEFNSSFDMLVHLDKNNPDIIYDITFHFQDIEGNKYTQKNRVGVDGYQHGFVKS